jgi:hypothetical protein
MFTIGLISIVNLMNSKYHHGMTADIVSTLYLHPRNALVIILFALRSNTVIIVGDLCAFLALS